jgi:N-methylhydantoinase A/oxoprolinase/acetone carboxylase beta subunit
MTLAGRRELCPPGATSDPRDFALYAFGGAGPVYAFEYAAESGAGEVVIPLGNGASTLSAYGIASGDVVLYRELERSGRAKQRLGPGALRRLEDRLAGGSGYCFGR